MTEFSTPDDNHELNHSLSSTEGPTQVSTGLDILDEILDGGYPRGRTTLLTGTPGTGKSTLAMQFLQAGLEDEESCLFISTEQPIDELTEAFDSFTFELTHDDLDITSLHARSGRTIESDESELVIETFDDGKIIGQGFSAPFNNEYISQVLTRYSDADRVVLDSVSGLRPMSESSEVYRRGILDLIQLFNKEFDATALFTAEHLGAAPRSDQIESLSSSDAVQYNVYGVLRLWREQIRESFRRFIDVMKMRGVDHDTRQFEITFDDEGVRVIPRNRSTPKGMNFTSELPTGLSGLDELLDGGLSMGTGTVLKHDGRANLDQLLFAIMSKAVAEELSIVMMPRVNTPPRRVAELFQRSGVSVEELKSEDRMFVLDAVGAWENGSNIFNLQNEDAGLTYLLEEIKNRHTGEGLFMLFNSESQVHHAGEEATREFRYWLEANLLDETHTLVDVHNPQVMGGDIADFFEDAASQVIDTWREGSGLQYLQLQKGESGTVGDVRLMDHTTEAPYVHLE